MMLPSKRVLASSPLMPLNDQTISMGAPLSGAKRNFTNPSIMSDSRYSQTTRLFSIRVWHGD